VFQDQRFAYPVVPGSYGFCNALFERLDIDARPAFLAETHDDVNARERGLGNLYLRFDLRGMQLLANHLLHLLANLRVVTITRHIDQSGIETAEHIAP
jgi:hypothetical protein